MPEQHKMVTRHKLVIDHRESIKATGILRVDFCSEEVITAQTDLGQLNIKGENLHIEKLSAESGDMIATGKTIAVSYSERGPHLSLLGRLFK